MESRVRSRYVGWFADYRYRLARLLRHKAEDVPEQGLQPVDSRIYEKRKRRKEKE